MLKVNISEFELNNLCYKDILYNITVTQESQRALHKSVKGPHKVIFHNIEPDAETVIIVTSHDGDQTFSSETQPQTSPNIGMLVPEMLKNLWCLSLLVSLVAKCSLV